MKTKIVELISRVSQVHFDLLKNFFFVSQSNVNIKYFWNFSHDYSVIYD